MHFHESQRKKCGENFCSCRFFHTFAEEMTKRQYYYDE